MAGRAPKGSISRDKPPPDTFDEIARRARRPREHVIEEWKERAAIREYLGGVPRVEAELAALREINQPAYQWSSVSST